MSAELMGQALAAPATRRPAADCPECPIVFGVGQEHDREVRTMHPG
ncbi:MAG: hypothetical protein WBF34_20055 [Streptosporangiaceae bacterium]